MEQSFFTPLLLRLWGLAVLFGGGPGRMWWEKRLPAPLCVHSVCCVTDPLGLPFSLLLQLLLCPVFLCPSPPPGVGTSPPFACALDRDCSLAWPGNSFQHFPHLPFLLSSKCLLLKGKSLGKSSDEAAVWGFSWTHLLAGALRGEAKVNLLEAKRESCTMWFFPFLDPFCKTGASHSTFCLEGEQHKEKVWKMLASDKIQRHSFSYIVNEWLSALPFVKALNPACK